MEWNPSLYDQKHNFVAEYGKGLLEFSPRREEQAILDLGCGTGILTAQLCKLGSRVMGIDSSRDMVEKAREQFETIEFRVCDAQELPFEKDRDVVFSNAVFHWIRDHDKLLQGIRRAIKPQALLVCEFGAKGNIEAIETAFATACKEVRRDYRPKFNFLTVERFGELLKNNGFSIEKIYDLDRPTVLKDGSQGLTNWIRQFFYF